MKITSRQLKQIIKEAIGDDQDFLHYETDAAYAELVDLLDDIASPGWIKWNLEDGLTKDEIIAKAQRGEERSREWMTAGDHSDDIGPQDMADAKRYSEDKTPEGMAKHLGISVEDWYRIRAELDDHYEDRFIEDQMAWEDDPEEERHPLDVDGDGKLTISETRITRKQLRQMIMESMSLLQEEDYDCIRDYKLMGYSHSEAVRMCGGGRSSYGGRSRQPGRYRYRPPARPVQEEVASQIKEVLDNFQEGLTDWESKFLRSVHTQLTQKGRRLSEKQDKIVKRILAKFDTGINPGDGKLTDQEADLMQDLAADAAAEEKEELSEIALTRDQMLKIIQDELESPTESESEFLTVQPHHKPMRRRGGG